MTSASNDPDENIVELARDEMYSGPRNESVPSAYTAYHPYHARSLSRSLESSRSGLLRRSSSHHSLSRNSIISSISQSSQTDETAVNPTRGRSQSRSSFRFFSWDEIEAAETSGTQAADELDPIEFEQQEEELDDEFPHTEEESTTKGFFRGSNRHYSRDTDDSNQSFLERIRSTQDSITDITGVSPDNAYPHSEKLFQRFYISEEDLMIGIAGYKSSRFRYFIYILVSLTTFGIGYLILRWFPRLWIKFLGRKCPLGRCDWVVIENQWGQLDFHHVTNRKYNRPLSTVFRLQEEKTEEEIPAENGSDTMSFAAEKVDPTISILRTLNYRYITLYYHPIDDLFTTNNDWIDSTWANPEQVSDGLEYETHVDREMVFGPNLIDIEEPPVMKLLVDEILHPFYVFQVFSIILWSLDQYYYYASCIFFISIISVGNALLETRRTLRRLKHISKFECKVRAFRNGYWNDTSSSTLVPGDIFEISDPSISILPCDSLLLSGDCIVNESMLTGESVPVSKIPATESTLQELVTAARSNDLTGEHAQLMARHVLYNGTKIVKVTKPKSRNSEGEYDVALAMVVKTGFSTTKGSLVRSMLFPKPSGFKFYEDSFKYIGVMGIIAIIGFAISTVNFIRMHMSTSLIIFRACDLITIVVPPALPATLTIGTNISLSRLRSKAIFCISPSRVNVGGKLDVVCFDKTGTLTEDGLDVLGVQLVQTTGKFGPLMKKVKKTINDKMLAILATCHSLRVVDGEHGDELIGDPLDIKMFEFAKWHFEEHDIGGGHFVRLSKPFINSKSYLQTGKSFEFVSQLRRMSVIVDSKGEKSDAPKYAYLKGAPEIMQQVCDATSFPENYHEQLHLYTHKGYRVIACAYKELEPDFNPATVKRTALESNMKFLGFIIFENKLKRSSAAVIEQLRKAKIRSIMCTGDNVLTATSVGRECKIIPSSDVIVYVPHFEELQDTDDDYRWKLRWECIDDDSMKLDAETLQPLVGSIGARDYTLAVTGDAFRHILERGTTNQLEQMLIKGSIFARMSPDEKHELVERLQNIDYTTGFCGDGANDCGALKAADVGISLSEAEASVAAPFTSRMFEISCVLDVISEGRCALATSFSCFKYMSLYSAIQFVSVSLLYSAGSNLGDFQFLWIDLFLILPIAIFMAWSKPNRHLGRKRPTANLVSRKVLVPLLSQVALFMVFQLIIWFFIKRYKDESWYIPPVLSSDENVESTENTAIFGATCFQYIFSAVILAQGPPFREPVFNNGPFCWTIAIATGISMMILNLDDTTKLGQLMNMTYTPAQVKIRIIGTMLVNLALSWTGETYVFPQMSRLVQKLKQGVGIIKTPKQYKILGKTVTMHV